MTQEEAWNELKETIIELRDNGGTGTQQEVCKFLANLMSVLEEYIQEQKTGYEEDDDVEDYEDRPEVQMMLVDTEGGEVWF